MAPKRIPFVENVTGSKNLHYRRDVPPDVRAVVGKTRWSESLRTAIPKEAARRARELAAEHDRTIAAARRPDPMTLLDPTEREKLDDAGGVDGYLRYLDDRAFEAGKLLSDAEHMREWAVAEQRPGPEQEPLPDPDWARGEAAALEAKGRSIQGELERASTLISKLNQNLASTPDLAQALEQLPPGVERATLSTIFEAWKTAKQPTAPEQFLQPVRVFEKLHGRLLLSQITKRNVREFRDHVAASGLKESTAAKHLRCVGTLLRFAAQEGYIDHSPATDIQFHYEKKKIGEAKDCARRTLTVEEVERLLAAADALPANDHGKLDTKWFARLALYSGARPEELSQLTSDDVAKLHGVHCIRIHDRGDNKLKTPASRRDIPLHPSLIEAGFLAFVKAREGAALLFATLKADGRGRIYSRMQRRLSRLMRVKAKITDTRVVPYSLRHSFKDMLRLVETPKFCEDRLMGHTTPETAIPDRYGGAQIVVLAKWLYKMNPLDKNWSVSDFDDED